MHHLLRGGMRTLEPSCPCRGFIYVAFQERATAVSHGNTARHVGAHGDDVLARVCGAIVADEKRHEAAYTRIVGDLYAHYAAAAQQAGVYTASDYRAILEHMIRQWGVEELAAGLSGEGRRARDYVCGLPRKIRRMEEKAHDRAAAQARKKPTPVPFSWIFDRPISVVLP